MFKLSNWSYWSEKCIACKLCLVHCNGKCDSTIVFYCIVTNSESIQNSISTGARGKASSQI